MMLRIMGTADECDYFVGIVLKNVPMDYIRSISKWYKNERKTQFSNEGRVYITFAEFPAEKLRLREMCQ